MRVPKALVAAAVSVFLFIAFSAGSLYIVSVLDDGCTDRFISSFNDPSSGGSVNEGFLCSLIGETLVSSSNSEGAELTRSSTLLGYLLAVGVVVWSAGLATIAFKKLNNTTS